MAAVETDHPRRGIERRPRRGQLPGEAGRHLQGCGRPDRRGQPAGVEVRPGDADLPARFVPGQRHGPFAHDRARGYRGLEVAQRHAARGEPGRRRDPGGRQVAPADALALDPRRDRGVSRRPLHPARDPDRPGQRAGALQPRGETRQVEVATIVETQPERRLRGVERDLASEHELPLGRLDHDILDDEPGGVERQPRLQRGEGGLVLAPVDACRARQREHTGVGGPFVSRRVQPQIGRVDRDAETTGLIHPGHRQASQADNAKPPRRTCRVRRRVAGREQGQVRRTVGERPQRERRCINVDQFDSGCSEHRRPGQIDSGAFKDQEGGLLGAGDRQRQVFDPCFERKEVEFDVARAADDAPVGLERREDPTRRQTG